MNKKIIFICIGLGFIITTLSAQVSKDTLIASQYYKKADSLYFHRELERSIDFFKKSLSRYQEAQVWKKVVACYNKIALNEMYLYRFEKSQKSSRKALEINEIYLSKENKEKADTYDNLGHYYEEASNFSEALTFYEKALTIRKKILPKNHLLLSNSYNNLGMVYVKTGEHKKNIHYQNIALAIKTKTLSPNHYKLGINYNNLAISFNHLGIYDKAILFYEKDLRVSLKKYGKDHIFIAYTYNNLAVVYSSIQQNNKALKYYKNTVDIFKKNKKYTLAALTSINIGKLYNNLGEYKKAIKIYNKTLPVLIKSYGKKHPHIIRTIQSMASTHENMDNYDNALSYHKEALFVSLKTLGEYHPLTSDSYYNLGRFYAKKGEYEIGLEYYNKSLNSLNKIEEKQNQHIANIYNSIANIYYKKNELEKSITYYNKSLLINHKSKKKINLHAIKEYLSAKVLLETLAGKATTLKELYLKNRNIDYLYTSSAIFQKVDSLMGTIRKSLKTHNDKITFSENAKKIYIKAIQTELLFHKIEKTIESLERVFHYSEKSKSNTLKELLTESKAINFAGLPTELLELERNLKNKRSFYESKISEELTEKTTDSSTISQYEKEIFDISRKQDSLIRVLEKKHPKYYNFKHKTNIVTVKDIQKNLNENTTLLEFFTSDSTYYAFVLSKDSYTVEELIIPDLSKNIRKLRSAITRNDIEMHNNIAYQLYKDLILPIANKINGDELIIVPDGSLWHLNFELLLTQKNTVEDTRNLPYLIRDYAISYTNSANVLFNPFHNNYEKSKIKQECLAFSFSNTTKLIANQTISLATLRNIDDDLPGTRKEIKAISKLINGQYFYGSEAIESNFKQNSNKYNILHLALHGEVDNANPQNSKLYFTKSKDTIEDNLLYSHELFALNIPAELAVLSACNTGTGKIANGEGIMSLGTAFQYAGTKSLVLSSWEVSDKSAPKLIENFYKNLADGMNKAKALQKAKLDFLKTADFEQVAPFYWGNFYLLGNADPIKIDKPLPIHIYWIVLLGILMFLALIFVYYKKIKP